MTLSSSLRLSVLAVCSVALLAVSACTADSPATVASGPGVENPAAALPGSVAPAIGGAGNGGGYSGGGGGAGGAGQGAR